ncbi:hypothetical protein V8C35DRAFT_315430 [Trichoderma chlorosporum]
MLAAVCTYILVQSGDSCASLATRCGITAADFTKYNPNSSLCPTPTIGQPVCCSSGALPNLTPQKNPDGTCASYAVKSGDDCALIAQNNYITVDNIEEYNSETLDWDGCSNLQLGVKICLSPGDTPILAAVADPENVRNSQTVAAMEESFTAALALSNYDVSEFENYNLTLLSTVLIGWDGCEKQNGFDPDQIRSGWQQSWKLMNLIYREARRGIEFDGMSAFEYLGPPAFNEDHQDAITGVFKNLATIQPGWFADSNPFSWKLAVRCDDPDRQCSKLAEEEKTAYTTNDDAKYGIARINFCPKYFSQQTLDQVIKSYANLELPWQIFTNMDNYYRNQGSIWIRELLYIDWVSKTGKYGTNQPLTDVKLKFEVGKYRKRGKDKFIYEVAHGPFLVKSLARFTPPEDPITHIQPGTYCARNADSLSLYVLVRYVQKALGNMYPHLPLPHQPPIDASPCS